MTHIYQLLFLVLTYFIAAIPFGLVLSRVFGKQDVRKAGSGNIGATNVARVLGKKLGLATLILDGAKGAIMIILARYIFANAQFLSVFLSMVGAVAVMAHIFPIYLQFKGGKGMATTLAVLLAINPTIGLLGCLAWVIIFSFTKISAIASLSSMLMVVGFAFYYNAFTEEILLAIFLALLVFIRHRENINRILKGTEPQFGKNNG